MSRGTISLITWTSCQRVLFLSRRSRITDSALPTYKTTESLSRWRILETPDHSSETSSARSSARPRGRGSARGNRRPRSPYRRTHEVQIRPGVSYALRRRAVSDEPDHLVEPVVAEEIEGLTRLLSRIVSFHRQDATAPARESTSRPASQPCQHRQQRQSREGGTNPAAMQRAFTRLTNIRLRVQTSGMQFPAVVR